MTIRKRSEEFLAWRTPATLLQLLLISKFTMFSRVLGLVVGGQRAKSAHERAVMPSGRAAACHEYVVVTVVAEHESSAKVSWRSASRSFASTSTITCKSEAAISFSG